MRIGRDMITMKCEHEDEYGNVYSTVEVTCPTESSLGADKINED